MSNYTDAWNNLTSSKKPLTIEQKVNQTLLWAPRDLRCPWDGCPHAQEPLVNIKALTQVSITFNTCHTPRHPHLGRKFPKKLGFPCRFTAGCKFISQTGDELMKHVQKAHLSILQATCHLCNYREYSFLSMLSHFERNHSISQDRLPLQIMTPPPFTTLRTEWINVPRLIPTYDFLVGRIRGDPTFDPRRDAVDISVLERKEGPLDFLDDDSTVEAMVIGTVSGRSRAILKQRREERGMIEEENNVVLGTYPMNNHIDIERGRSWGTTTAFYAGLRNEPPLDRPKLSNPVPYRIGQPVVPRRPPPTITNFFGMKEIVSPMLQKQQQQQQHQQQQQEQQQQ
ncbi:hypothetical protein FRC17_006904 [Serendipita sp. 399]|nr:hypothetical protein FRC17_006904 [Serendipita sp. 399]